MVCQDSRDGGPENARLGFLKIEGHNLAQFGAIQRKEAPP
jgi:hypothetical protein